MKKRREEEEEEKDIEKNEGEEGVRREGTSHPPFPAWQALART